MIRMMYWVTCVQVIAFIPPMNEHSSTPTRPINTPTG